MAAICLYVDSTLTWRHGSIPDTEEVPQMGLSVTHSVSHTSWWPATVPSQLNPQWLVTSVIRNLAVIACNLEHLFHKHNYHGKSSSPWLVGEECTLHAACWCSIDFCRLVHHSLLNIFALFLPVIFHRWVRNWVEHIPCCVYPWRFRPLHLERMDPQCTASQKTVSAPLVVQIDILYAVGIRVLM